jgi:hypothetical protein
MIPKKNLQLYHKLDNVKIVEGLTNPAEHDTIRQEILDEVLQKEFPTKEKTKPQNIFARR